MVSTVVVAVTSSLISEAGVVPTSWAKHTGAEAYATGKVFVQVVLATKTHVPANVFAIF